MYFLYKSGIRLYYFLIRIISPVNQKASAWLRGRRAQSKEQWEKIPDGKPVIWFHASSLGEFEQGLPLIRKWKTEKPEYFILLSFFSPSGYNIRKAFDGADRVVYIPRDIPGEVRKFLGHYHPDIAVFIKYEIWPVALRELAARKAPCFLVSAVFRPGQLFFKWYGGWYLSLLRLFTGIFVQDDASLQLLADNGIGNAIVAGDTRVDRVLELSSGSSMIDGIDGFSTGTGIIIAGSSWPREEQMLHRFFSENAFRNFKLILAPHDISPGRLKSVESLFGDNLIRYGRLLDEPSAGINKKVLLIDRIGLLSSLYKYGDIAVIGGAFGMGLHNILEPAVFGLPVVFGPRYQSFMEAEEMVKAGAGFSVKSYAEFSRILKSLVEDNNARTKAGKASRSFVHKSKGATSLIISHLLENA